MTDEPIETMPVPEQSAAFTVLMEWIDRQIMLAFYDGGRLLDLAPMDKASIEEIRARSPSAYARGVVLVDPSKQP